MPHHAGNDPGNLQLISWFDGRILGIRSDQGYAFPPLAQVFHGPLPVHFGYDDIAALWRLAPVHDDHVAGEDARAGHGVARDLEEKRGRAVADEEVIERECVSQFLLGRAGKTRLDGAKLRGANLKWANLSRASLRNADLREADLFHATFDEADMTGARVGKANLFGANLIGTRAPGADFSGAYLKDVLMEGIDLSGGSLADTYMLRGVITGGRFINISS